MQFSKEPTNEETGELSNQPTFAQGASLVHNKVNTREVPMLGILEAGKGRIGLLGDSSCVDDKEADLVRILT